MHLLVLVLLAQAAPPLCESTDVNEGERCRPTTWERALTVSLPACLAGTTDACADVMRVPRPPWPTRAFARALTDTRRACAAASADSKVSPQDACLVLGVFERRYADAGADAFMSACERGETLGCAMAKILAGGRPAAAALGDLRTERTAACAAGREARCTAVTLLLLEEEGRSARRTLEEELDTACRARTLAACDALTDPFSRLLRLRAGQLEGDEAACVQRRARDACKRVAEKGTIRWQPVERDLLFAEAACALGEASLCARAGAALLASMPTERSTDWNLLVRGRDLLERGCAAKDAASCVELAILLHTMAPRLNRYSGPPPPKSALADALAAHKRGEQLLAVWCDRGEGRACEHLYVARQAGALPERERIAAFRIGARACELGSALMCTHVAAELRKNIGWTRPWGDRRHSKEMHVFARGFFTHTCATSGDGCVELGDMHASTYWLDVDRKKARAAYERACTQKPGGAGCERLALLDLVTAVEGARGDAVTPAREQACARGHAESCVRLAAALEPLARTADGRASPEAKLAMERYGVACRAGHSLGCLAKARLQARFVDLGVPADSFLLMDEAAAVTGPIADWPAVDVLSIVDADRLCKEGVRPACGARCASAPEKGFTPKERAACLALCEAGVGPCLAADPEMLEAGCGEGGAYDCTRLAEAYVGSPVSFLKGKVPVDRARAAALFRQGCRLWPQACTRAEELERGKATPEEKALARELYDSGCARGDAESCDQQGSALMSAGRESWDAAARPLRRACELELADASRADDADLCPSVRARLGALCTAGVKDACVPLPAAPPAPSDAPPAPDVR